VSRIVRNASARAERFERGDEPLVLVGREHVVGALDDVLPAGSLRSSIGTSAPFHSMMVTPAMYLAIHGRTT
jgi:hypothetical protein